MWICAVQWVTCGANAPDRIAGALQMNTQPCLNGTGNNLVHRGFDRAFGRGARRESGLGPAVNPSIDGRLQACKLLPFANCDAG